TDKEFGHPAQILSATGSSLGTFLVNPTGDGMIQIIRIDNPLTSPTFLTQILTGTSSRPFPDEARQPGTSTTIDIATTGQDSEGRTSGSNAVWLNGVLYTVATIGPVSGPDAGLATAHWYKIDTGNPNALTILDQGDVGGSLLGAGSGVATCYPTIIADPNGDFVINFSASGPNLYAGAYYALHAAG